MRAIQSRKECKLDLIKEKIKGSLQVCDRNMLKNAKNRTTKLKKTEIAPIV